jgi:hypothetical protein
MRPALHLALLSVLPVTRRMRGNTSTEPSFCTTASSRWNVMSRSSKGKSSPRSIECNTEEQNPTPCGPATVAFMRGPELGTARSKDSALQIVRVLVVGAETPEGIRPVRPTPYFTAFEVVEYDV